MPSRSRAKKTHPVQTFDPEDFDAHAMDHSIRGKIRPLARGEKLVRVEKDLRVFQGHEKLGRLTQTKSILVSVFANVLLPGLGNVYAHSNPFSISILVLSLLVLIVTFSPIFPIVGLLGAAHIAQPNAPEGMVLTLFVPNSVVVGNQSLLVGPTFSVLIVPLLLAWLHLLYLLVNKPGKIDWAP